MPGPPGRSVDIDLAAIRHNVSTLKQVVAPAQLLTVVKADGYGHGALPVALAARAAGADMIGAAHLQEAITLREGGYQGPLLAWLHTPDAPFEEALRRNIQIGCSGWDLDVVVATATALNITATVHLKIDTGLGRNGAVPTQWKHLFGTAMKAQQAGHIQVAGIFSHLAASEELEHPATKEQLAVFDEALALAASLGLEPPLQHIANSAGAIAWPEARRNMVRVGLATYGMSPFTDRSAEELGLIPAMTLRARIASIKEVPQGHGVSYGLRYQTPEDSTLALIPLGYADGVPRSSWAAPVRIANKTYKSAGVIAMDQFVVDLGEHPVDETIQVGTDAVLFGPAPAPSAQDWAMAAGTINYEVTTRMTARGPRRYFNGEYTFALTDPAQTQTLAEHLAALLEPGDGVILTGELGAGKTTFTQGLARGLGIQETVTSPTFVIARHHPNPHGPALVHVDAYRLESAGELYDLDLDQSVPTSVTVVEWGKDRAEELFSSHLEIELIRATGHNTNTTDFSEEDTAEPRQLIIRCHGERFLHENFHTGLAALMKDD